MTKIRVLYCKTVSAGHIEKTTGGHYLKKMGDYCVIITSKTLCITLKLTKHFMTICGIFVLP